MNSRKAENSSEKESSVSMPSTKSLLSFIHDKDARLGLVLSVFILLLLVFTWFNSAYGSITEGGFFGLIRTFIVFLLIATAFVIFFKAIDGSILPRVIVWYFTSLLLLTSSIFWIQGILRTPAPFLIEARCFVSLWSQGCPLGTNIAQNIEPAPPIAEEPQRDGAAIPDIRNIVYVQFAGALQREKVVNVSQQLQTNGWNVQGLELGGERTAKAAGVDQVRYFHAEDEELAINLATKYNDLADWQGFDQLAVAYVAGYESRVPIGHLEVWTSVD